MTAQVACGTCGTDLRENAKFCDECGATTAVPSTAAKYKQVTVLFADVVRSMDIAATVDMERLRDIMVELVERAASVVRRYGGTVEYTGDGVMALFGAPIALEDHAFRGCLAALAIQDAAGRLAAEVASRDGIELLVRIGLNSGRVIAGEIGSGSARYTVTGETIGFAQRMEAAAPPGKVLLSESTARLVEGAVKLGEPLRVHIKHADQPVAARQLMAIGCRDGGVGRVEAGLVGRGWEMAALNALVDRAIDGRGSVANVVGPPGIGKSRVAREAAATAADRGVEVVWTFCESHTRDIPFNVVSQLLRATRERLTADVPDVDPQDLLLLDELLGATDPTTPLPQIDPEARRRRLTALINAACLARTEPALFIIEDAHWIDAVSESMLADLLAVIPRTPTIVLITARPEYEGTLTRVHGGQTIALAPLGDSDTASLISELVGSDPSIGELSAIITDRAAGNPFFAEEIVRELVQRGALTGPRGGYLCRADVSEVSVPTTVQAAIAARIDRLSTAASRTISAASVIGTRFDAELLSALEIQPVLDELIDAELIDQVRFTPSAEYAFHHPLIHAVAYESQLKSERADWHRRVAVAIEQRALGAADDSAALIAEHLEAAGQLHEAYGWHMRAATSSASRNVDAARVSWERACRIADALPAGDPAHVPMRIAPRTMLCATDWQARAVQESHGRFEELRALCELAGDKVALAIGMTGLVTEHLFAGRSPEGVRLVDEQMALLESIGDPNLTVGLAFQSLATWFDIGEFGEILRWSQTVVDLAERDSVRGAGFGIGSPLAMALAFRGLVRCWLGGAGWRDDVENAIDMARNSDPTTLALVFTWAYGVQFVAGALRVDDAVLATIEEAVAAARQAGSDTALIYAEYGLGGTLMYRNTEEERHRGLDLVLRAREKLSERVPCLLPAIDILVAASNKSADRRAAISAIRTGLDELQRQGRLHGGYGVVGATLLVEALLERGGEADVVEAEAAMDRLSDLAAEKGLVILDVILARLHTLLARARGDDAARRDLALRYREIAKAVDYEVHIAWAEAMLE
jgi:class 3 adenylate cyclase